MVIINGSVQYNGGFHPDNILSTQRYYHRGIRLKCHEEVLYFQLLIPPKSFDIFPLTGGCSEGLDAFSFFFIQHSPRDIRTHYTLLRSILC